MGDVEARLLEHGIEPDNSVPIPGYDRFEFRDPFGNRVEMIQEQLKVKSRKLMRNTSTAMEINDDESG